MCTRVRVIVAAHLYIALNAHHLVLQPLQLILEVHIWRVKSGTICLVAIILSKVRALAWNDVQILVVCWYECSTFGISFTPNLLLGN